MHIMLMNSYETKQKMITKVCTKDPTGEDAEAAMQWYQQELPVFIP